MSGVLFLPKFVSTRSSVSCRQQNGIRGEELVDQLGGQRNGCYLLRRSRLRTDRASRNRVWPGVGRQYVDADVPAHDCIVGAGIEPLGLDERSLDH